MSNRYAYRYVCCQFLFCGNLHRTRTFALSFTSTLHFHCNSVVPPVARVDDNSCSHYGNMIRSRIWLAPLVLSFLLLLSFGTAFVALDRVKMLCRHPPNKYYDVVLMGAADDANEDKTDDDEEDEGAFIKPYRNRSLAWTKRYRKLNPYERVRARVISFGHRSKSDWDDAVSSGQLGQYVPSYPDEMYAPEWVGWDEWLGLMRSYDDTKNLASTLGLKSLDEYVIFVRSNNKRAEGLRIPVRPDIYYKDQWIDEDTFFGRQS